MLVVMAIVSMLVALSVAVTRPLMQANRITSAASVLVNQINLARMTAIKLNKPVEMRFYSYRDAESGSPAAYYQAYQLWVGEVAHGDLIRLGGGVAFSTLNAGSANSCSNLLDAAVNTSGGAQPVDTTKVVIGGAATSPTPRQSSFQFRSDGSTNLNGTTIWTLTLVSESDADQASLPANFVTLSIDPLTGSVKTIRPN